jgi:hypothetical protein
MLCCSGRPFFMSLSRRKVALGFCFFLGGVVLACGGAGTPSGFNDHDGGEGGSSPNGDGGGAQGSDGGVHINFEAGDSQGPGGGDSAPPAPIPVVYAESPDTLYQLDPTTNAVTVVAAFSGDCESIGALCGEAANDCGEVIDIALDEMSNGYATTFGGLYRFDVKTAVTTLIAAGGSYPNSLSFVPAGTLNATAESLVGYVGSTYVQIDTTTGTMTNVGSLSGGYISSGDIVSVKGGGTFLTVTGNGCGDCLLQVDPKTGDIIQNYGSVNHPEVYGIAFWAGAVYGFDNGGQVFSITFPAGKLVTTPIKVPTPPPGLEFWGAGSTTSAPPKAADGGGIPIK